MSFFKYLFFFAVLFLLFSCVNRKEDHDQQHTQTAKKESVLIDCNYTFEQAIEGTKAPKFVIDQLELITVHYYSMDGKIHQGQLLANKLITNDLREIFRDIFQSRFPVEKVIPVVRYGWNDEASMNDNNTYSFCYRNAGYSKHARGLAIDINPRLNPNRWKPGFSYRKNKPEGAVYNPNVPGTFTETSSVVALFREKGFFWGRNFSRNHDDHHFEKKGF